ncbi:MAG TPA: hypothetical protein VD713_04215, partial [Sphingomonadales bacterium]|nr:hypothetical protein [Sphingomonadales bacterium]
MAATRKQLLQALEAFLAETGMNPTEFGIRACNDGGIVTRLRTGNPTMRNIERIERFLARHGKKAGARRDGGPSRV